MKLVIAEKKSVAESIAAVLKAKERKDGFFIGNGYAISWCVGHLLELAEANVYDEKYAKWRYEDLPIVPSNWKHVVSKDKQKQLKVLSELMKRTDVDTVVCATDAGREGELIFRLVYEHCKCKKPIQRLWISSMEEKAVMDGFNNLKEGKEYDKLYQSALCRSQADWLVGINATRLFSVLYGQTLNVGRVFTPTLALIVNRENEISAFVKEPFYIVELDCGNFIATSEKTKDRKQADGVMEVCNGKTAYIANINKQEKSIQPPKLYDLTTLQREANRLYGFTANQTLEYAQSLYEKKLSTYPRTDSRFLTGDMAAGLQSLVKAVSNVLPFTSEIDHNIDVMRVIDNSKVSDHHAIIPTQTATQADLSALPAGERDILYMLSTRLICAVSAKHTYAETTVTVNCENHVFTAKGKTILNYGWKAYENSFKALLKNKTKENDSDDAITLPVLSENQSFSSVKTALKEGFTSPPKHFTEDTLLSSMESAGAEDMPEDAERKGLGTPATRADVIERLVSKQFVERKQKQLLPTKKGIDTITVLPEMIKSPTLTAEWENQLKQVERGELPNTAFMNGIAEMVTNLVSEHSTANPEFATLFPTMSKGEVIGTCPRCGKNIIENKKGFFCENRDCEFVLWKDNKFFSSKKKQLTNQIAAVLLKDGRVKMTGLYSEKTGKAYNAIIILDDTGGKYVNFKLEF